MEWTHLKPADGRRMPWKNGGGTTLELAVEPPGATLETGFRWRLSSAEVRSSGPFSAFPGLDRWLLLLEGAGLGIDFGPQGQAMLTDLRLPLCFSGDWPARATLLEGPITDLNLMVDPSWHQARLEVFEVASSLRLPLSAATTLLFVARGTVALPEWQLYLGQRHLLRIERGEGDLAITPGVGGATLVRMDLDPV